MTGTFPFAADTLPSAARVWCSDRPWSPHLKDGGSSPELSTAARGPPVVSRGEGSG